MKFALIYHGGNVSPSRAEENCAQLWKWIEELQGKCIQTSGIIANGGKTVSHDAVNDYSGKVFGLSIIEAESMDAALQLTKDWPEFQYGGRLDILRSL